MRCPCIFGGGRHRRRLLTRALSFAVALIIIFNFSNIWLWLSAEAEREPLAPLKLGDALLYRLHIWRLLYELVFNGPRTLLVHPGYRVVLVDVAPWAGQLRGTREADLRVSETIALPAGANRTVLRRAWLPPLNVKSMTLQDLVHSAGQALDMSIIMKLRELFASTSSMSKANLKEDLFSLLLEILGSRVPDVNDLSDTYGSRLRSVVEGLGDPRIIGILAGLMTKDHVGNDDVCLALEGKFPNSATRFRILLHVWAPLNPHVRAGPHTHQGAWFASKILRGNFIQYIWASASAESEEVVEVEGTAELLREQEKQHAVYDNGIEFLSRSDVIKPISSARFKTNDTYVFPLRWAHSVHPIGASREELLGAPFVSLEFRVKGAGREPLYLNVRDEQGSSHSHSNGALFDRVRTHIEAYLLGDPAPFFDKSYWTDFPVSDEEKRKLTDPQKQH